MPILDCTTNKCDVDLDQGNIKYLYSSEIRADSISLRPEVIAYNRQITADTFKGEYLELINDSFEDTNGPTGEMQYLIIRNFTERINPNNDPDMNERTYVHYKFSVSPADPVGSKYLPEYTLTSNYEDSTGWMQSFDVQLIPYQPIMITAIEYI